MDEIDEAGDQATLTEESTSYKEEDNHGDHNQGGNWHGYRGHKHDKHRRNRNDRRKYQKRMRTHSGGAGTSHYGEDDDDMDDYNDPDGNRKRGRGNTGGNREASTTEFVLASNDGSVEFNDSGTQNLLETLYQADTLSIFSRSLVVTCEDEATANAMREMVSMLSQHRDFMVKDYRERPETENEKSENVETSESGQLPEEQLSAAVVESA